MRRLIGTVLVSALLSGCGYTVQKIDTTHVPPNNRNFYIDLLAQTQEIVREHWDMYGAQIKKVRKLCVYSSLIHGCDAGLTSGNDKFDTIEIADYSPRVFVHELCHVWQDNIQDTRKFENDWSAITGIIYKSIKPEDIASGAFANEEAAENMMQDVADTCEFVFEASLPNSERENDFLFKPGNERAEGKIKLLEKYKFISRDEMKKALNSLNNPNY